jgi:hypothetical protein
VAPGVTAPGAPRPLSEDDLIQARGALEATVAPGTAVPDAAVRVLARNLRTP